MLKKIVGISLVVASLFAKSHTIDNRWEVGIGAGYMDAENSKQIDNYGIGTIRVGKYFQENNLLRVEFEMGDSTDLRRTLLNYEHDFQLNSQITPYAYLGVGMEDVKKENYDLHLVGDFGLGAKYALKKDINLFAEARALRNFEMNDNHYGAIVGVNFEFGEKKVIYEDSDKDGILDNVDKCPNTPKGVKVDTNGCPLDSDNDGVADYLDKCANTPEGAKVDTNGCPIDSDKDGVFDNLDKCPNTPEGVEVDTNGCPLDSDNDGVIDNFDKCPNTPEGVEVDTNGCPLDSDNDGVADYLDKCPNTPCGIHVTQNGCPVTFNLNVYFEKNSAKLLDSEKPQIERFANFLKENIGYDAEIQGYTDSTGPKSYNIQLSKRRAKAVYDYLIKLGISPDRLTYKGYGPANPIADNSTEEGRRLNRRVVAKLIINTK